MEGKFVDAFELFSEIVKCISLAGVPYILNKDEINKKSNQKNLGTIKTSNLCVEIVEYTDKDNIASCNLASICLPKILAKGNSNKCNACNVCRDCNYNKCQCHGSYYNVERYGKCDTCTTDVCSKCNLCPDCIGINPCTVKCRLNNNYIIDYKKLESITRKLVRNLNNVIDKTYYIPEIPQIKNSNLRDRPIGIGVQGFADLICMLNLTWSNEIRVINNNIFETIYYAALDESNKISIELGKYYGSFKGSPLSHGLFQFDLWNDTYHNNYCNIGGRYNWEKLRISIIKHGVYNSQLIALMPTASTSLITGNSDSFEPFNGLYFSKELLSGSFLCINKYFIEDCKKLNIWGLNVLNSILENNDSLSSFTTKNLDITFLKEKYKTAYEIPKKFLISLSAQRAKYVCQSQSLNHFMEETDLSKIASVIMYGWECGLKTISYYFRFKLNNSVRPRYVKNIQKDNAQLDVLYNTSATGVVCQDDICKSCTA